MLLIYALYTNPLFGFWGEDRFFDGVTT